MSRINFQLKGRFCEFSEENLKIFLHEYNSLLKKKFSIDTPFFYKDFEILEVLGEGSFATVTKLYDSHSKIFYAKKTLKETNNFKLLAFNEILPLVYLEKIDNKALLQIFRIDFGTNLLEIYMECGLGTLRDFMDFLEIEKNIYPNFYSDLSADLMSQLDILKSNDLVHRDIKPENIIITKGLQFKFTDYGCCEKARRHFEQPISIKGTPRYWHPSLEEAMSQNLAICMLDPYDSDAYSVKVILDEVSQIVKNCQALATKKEIESKFENFVLTKFYSKPQYMNKRDKILESLLEHRLFDELKLKIHNELKELKNDKVQSIERKKYLLEKLARAYHEEGHIEEALETNLRILEFAETYLENEISLINKTKLSIAKFRIELKLDYKETISLLESVDFSQEKIIQTELFNLMAQCFLHQNDLIKADFYINKSLEEIAKLDHERSIDSSSLTLAKVLAYQQNFEQSSWILQGILDYRLEKYSFGSWEQAEIFDELANFYILREKIDPDRNIVHILTQENIKKAIELKEKSLEIKKNLRNEKYLAEDYALLGELYMNTDVKKANEFLEKSVDIIKKYSLKNLLLLQVLENSLRILINQENQEEFGKINSLIKQALEIRLSLKGDEVSDHSSIYKALTKSKLKPSRESLGNRLIYGLNSLINFGDHIFSEKESLNSFLELYFQDLRELSEKVLLENILSYLLLVFQDHFSFELSYKMRAIEFLGILVSKGCFEKNAVNFIRLLEKGNILHGLDEIKQVEFQYYAMKIYFELQDYENCVSFENKFAFDLSRDDHIIMMAEYLKIQTFSNLKIELITKSMYHYEKYLLHQYKYLHFETEKYYSNSFLNWNLNQQEIFSITTPGSKHESIIYKKISMIKAISLYYLICKNYEDAVIVINQAILIAKRNLKNDHSILIHLSNIKGIIHSYQQKYKLANHTFEYSISLAVLNKNHEELINTYYYLASLNKIMRRYSIESSYRLKIYKEKLDCKDKILNFLSYLISLLQQRPKDVDRVVAEAKKVLSDVDFNPYILSILNLKFYKASTLLQPDSNFITEMKNFCLTSSKLLIFTEVINKFFRSFSFENSRKIAVLESLIFQIYGQNYEHFIYNIILINLVESKICIGNYKEAVDNLSKIYLSESKLVNLREETLEDYLFSLMISNSQIEKALEVISTILQKREKYTLAFKTERLARLYRNKAFCHFFLNQFDEATKAIELIKTLSISTCENILCSILEAVLNQNDKTLSLTFEDFTEIITKLHSCEILKILTFLAEEFYTRKNYSLSKMIVSSILEHEKVSKEIKEKIKRETIRVLRLDIQKKRFRIIATCTIFIKRLEKQNSGLDSVINKRRKELHQLVSTRDDYDPVIANYYDYLGILLYLKGKHLEAINYHERAAKIYSVDIKFWNEMASCYDNIGVNYSKLGKYENSILYHGRALDKRLKESPNDFPGLTKSYEYLYVTYKHLSPNKTEEFDEKVKFYRLQSLEQRNFCRVLYADTGILSAHDKIFQLGIDEIRNKVKIKEYKVKEVDNLNALGSLFLHSSLEFSRECFEAGFAKVLNSETDSLNIFTFLKNILLTSNNPNSFDLVKKYLRILNERDSRFNQSELKKYRPFDDLMSSLEATILKGYLERVIKFHQLQEFDKLRIQYLHSRSLESRETLKNVLRARRKIKLLTYKLRSIIYGQIEGKLSVLLKSCFDDYVHNLENLGIISFLKSDFTNTQAYYMSLAYQRIKVGDNSNLVIIYDNLASICYRMQKYSEALSYVNLAYEKRNEIGDMTLYGKIIYYEYSTILNRALEKKQDTDLIKKAFILLTEIISAGKLDEIPIVPGIGNLTCTNWLNEEDISDITKVFEASSSFMSNFKKVYLISSLFLNCNKQRSRSLVFEFLGGNDINKIYIGPQSYFDFVSLLRTGILLHISSGELELGIELAGEIFNIKIFQSLENNLFLLEDYELYLDLIDAIKKKSGVSK